MAHNSFGVDDPVAIIPVSPTPGYGEYPGAQITDDGDNRDAASAMAACEALLDRTNFLAWRMINIIEGGVYAFTSLIDLANKVNLRGRLARFGTKAWMALRAPIHVNGPDGTIYTFTDADVFVIDEFTHGQTRTYIFAPPTSDVPALYRFKFRSPAIPKGVDGSLGSGDDHFVNSGTLYFKYPGANRAFLKISGGSINREIPWVSEFECDSAVPTIYGTGGSINGITPTYLP